VESADDDRMSRTALAAERADKLQAWCDGGQRWRKDAEEGENGTSASDGKTYLVFGGFGREHSEEHIAVAVALLSICSEYFAQRGRGGRVENLVGRGKETVRHGKNGQALSAASS